MATPNPILRRRPSLLASPSTSTGFLAAALFAAWGLAGCTTPTPPPTGPDLTVGGDDAGCSGVCPPLPDLKGGGSDLATAGDGGRTDGSTGSDGGRTDGSTGSDGGRADGGSDGGMTYKRLCDAPPPAGATVAPPPPRYSGTCPTLVAGRNTITSSGGSRSFLLALPTTIDPSERLPLVFLWHWLGGSADDFLKKGEVQAAVDSQRFIAILPDAKSDMLFKWPFDVGVTAARQEQEYVFFDDMLACATAQFNVNTNCVSSAGVSAGALFTDQLVGGRGKYLASALSLSGGVGGVVKPFGNPDHRLPMMVLWGGDKDNCLGVVDFNVASHNLEAALVSRGHFFVECIHNCGHAEPPFDAPGMLSKYAGLWQFVFDHPYWLGAGDSPYKTGGIPSGAGYPAWCGIGKGSATPRTGTCPNKPGC